MENYEWLLNVKRAVISTTQAFITYTQNYTTAGVMKESGVRGGDDGCEVGLGMEVIMTVGRGAGG